MEYDIGHVSYWAQTFSLKGQIDSLVVQAMGMQAENMARESRGESMAYNDVAFNDIAKQIDYLAASLAKI